MKENRDVLRINREYSEKFVQPDVASVQVPGFLKKYVRKAKSLIDLGCGDGGMIYGFSKEVKNVKVTGIDISPRRINALKKKFPKFNFFCKDVCNTGLKSNQYDLVYSSQVIEHVENDNEMISEIKRITKKNAIIYLGTVMHRPWAVYKYRNRKGLFCLDPTHEREYGSMEQFANLLEKNKLKIIKIWKTPIHRFIAGIRMRIPGFFLIETICKK